MRKLIVIFACFGLMACSDPMADIGRLSDQDLAPDAGTVDVAAIPTPEGASLLERLMGRADDTATPEAANLAAPTGHPTEGATSETTQVSDQTSAPSPDAQPVQLVEAAPRPEPKKTGLLAMLTRAAPPKQDVVPTPQDQIIKAALRPQPDTEPADDPAAADTGTANVNDPDPAPGTKHISIFGINNAKTPAKAVSEVAPDTVLPYGKVARMCGLPKRELGSKVAQYPEKRARHRIYDTSPGSTAPRTFYVTGFDDGCARQFTASLAMFGSASMHEQLRYGLPSEVQPYSTTDKAYEKLKSRVCGVSRKKPCGAKVSRMEQSTVFLSIYERFGSNARWANLLLHNGDILAQDLKGG